jgi:hypothetical protein
MTNIINNDKILALTEDCFQQMAGGNDTSHDFPGLIPYLIAHNMCTVNRKTMVPAGLVMEKGKVPAGTPYWTEIPLGSVLRPLGLRALNKELCGG